MKYKIKIVNWNAEVTYYERESKHNNFFNALDDDLSDIFEIILDDKCMEYDFERLYNCE